MPFSLCRVSSAQTYGAPNKQRQPKCQSEYHEVILPSKVINKDPYQYLRRLIKFLRVSKCRKVYID